MQRLLSDARDGANGEIRSALAETQSIDEETADSLAAAVGWFYLFFGQYTKAMNYYEQALEIQQQAYTRAIPLLVEAATICYSTVGGQHNTTKKCIKQLQYACSRLSSCFCLCILCGVYILENWCFTMFGCKTKESK